MHAAKQAAVPYNERLRDKNRAHGLLQFPPIGQTVVETAEQSTPSTTRKSEPMGSSGLRRIPPRPAPHVQVPCNKRSQSWRQRVQVPASVKVSRSPKGGSLDKIPQKPGRRRHKEICYYSVGIHKILVLILGHVRVAAPAAPLCGAIRTTKAAHDFAPTRPDRPFRPLDAIETLTQMRRRPTRWPLTIMSGFARVLARDQGCEERGGCRAMSLSMSKLRKRQQANPEPKRGSPTRTP